MCPSTISQGHASPGCKPLTYYYLLVLIWKNQKMYLSSCLAGRIKRKQNNPKHQLRCFCCCFTSSHKLASDDIDLYKSIRPHYRPHSQVFKPSCLGSCGLLGLALLIRWPSRCIALQPCSSCLGCSSRGHWPCSWLVGADKCSIWQWFLLKLPFACL